MIRLTKSLALRLALAALALVAATALAACAATAPAPVSSTPSDTTQSSTAPSATEASPAPQPATPAPAAQTAPPATDAELKEPKSPASVKTLVIKDIVKGTGPSAKAGDSVSVDYTGWLTNGTKFDSSVGKQAFPLTIGGGQVIAGWDKGLVGMKVGGIRQLVIPSDLGYGPNGYPPAIPGNATLQFTVKLISIGQ